MKALWEVSAETLQSVIQTNLLGLAYCSQVAIKGMLSQGHGHIYNMEGHGSNGQVMNGMSGYGASKSAVRYLTKSLIQETQGTNVKISTLSPGMVNTSLLADQFQDDPDGLSRAEAIFNLLGDPVETVAPWLVERVLENEKAGAAIAWFTLPKVMWRLANAALKNRDLFNFSNPSQTYVGKYSG